MKGYETMPNRPEMIPVDALNGNELNIDCIIRGIKD